MYQSHRYWSKITSTAQFGHPRRQRKEFFVTAAVHTELSTPFNVIPVTATITSSTFNYTNNTEKLACERIADDVTSDRRAIKVPRRRPPQTRTPHLRHRHHLYPHPPLVQLRPQPATARHWQRSRSPFGSSSSVPPKAHKMPN